MYDYNKPKTLLKRKRNNEDEPWKQKGLSHWAHWPKVGHWRCDVCQERFSHGLSKKKHLEGHFRKEDIKMHLFFANLTGTKCTLKNLKNTKVMTKGSFHYRSIEVRLEINPTSIKSSLRDHLQEPENLLMLIPESFMINLPCKLLNFSVPYTAVSEEEIQVEFPAMAPSALAPKKQEVKVTRITGNNIGIPDLIGKEELVLITKSRLTHIAKHDGLYVEFEGGKITMDLISKTDSGKLFSDEQAESSDTKFRAERDAFYRALKKQRRTMKPKEWKEVEKQMTMESFYQDSVPEEEQMKYSCPFGYCNFVSKNKFIGVRVHLVKHFEKEIR